MKINPSVIQNFFYNQKIYIYFICLFLVTSCGPKLIVSSANEMQKLDRNEKVVIFTQSEKLPETVEFVGSLNFNPKERGGL